MALLHSPSNWTIRQPKLFLLSLMWLIVGFFKLFFTWRYKKCSSKASLHGKTVIVTGANRGIGSYTAYDLAKRGGKVILACRNLDQASKVAQDIVKRTGNSHVLALPLDMSSFASIRKFADGIIKTQERLDILIHNAGIHSSERRLTKDGFEEHFQVHALGPYLLTKLLLPLMKKSRPSRVIFLSSTFHYLMLTMDTSNMNSDQFYQPDLAYGKSKLANILIARYLSSKFKDSGVTFNALCTGFVDTNLTRGHYIANHLFLVKLYFKYMFQNNEEGAQTVIYCAVEPSLENVSGKYFMFCELLKPSILARDRALASEVYNIAEDVTER